VRAWGYGDKIEIIRQAFVQNGAWIILLKGVMPIPYKIITIASGFAGYNFGAFVGLSLLTRGARFFAESFLLKRYGPGARLIIEKRLGLWVTIGALVLVGGIVAALYLI
jgi:membrane protein YqaA with SNARE-associated domain